QSRLPRPARPRFRPRPSYWGRPDERAQEEHREGREALGRGSLALREPHTCLRAVAGGCLRQNPQVGLAVPGSEGGQRMSDEAVPTVAPVTPRDELLTVTGTLVGHYHLTYTSGMLIELDLELDAEDYDNEQRIEAIRDISMCSRDGKALAYA